jgi:hypothetical protein
VKGRSCVRKARDWRDELTGAKGEIALKRCDVRDWRG